MDYMQFFIVLAALFALYWLYEVEYKRYRLDKFRDNLFQIRGALFDAAARGEIPLDHPTYLILRTNINGVIRFSHDLSFFRFLLMRFEVKSEAGQVRAESYKRKMRLSMATLSDAQRSLIISTNKELHKAVMLYIAYNSLMGKAISIIAGIAALVFLSVKLLIGRTSRNADEVKPAFAFVNMKIMRRPIEVLDAEANMVGCAI